MLVHIYILIIVSFPRYHGHPADLVVFEKNVADLSAKLEVYDKILSKQKYLVGNVRQFSSD